MIEVRLLDKYFHFNIYYFIANISSIKYLTATLFSVSKFLKNHQISSEDRLNNNVISGLWPSVFNLATKAAITTNSTCGENGMEEFCRMSDSGKFRCGICDNFSSDSSKTHSIQFAIDGTNKWWQSSALFYGPQYEFVTIIIDLKQVRIKRYLKKISFKFFAKLFQFTFL